MTTVRGCALVSGASRGLGAAIAVHLASMGYAVAVNHRRSAEDADLVVEQIRRAGGQASAVAADVTDPAQVSSMIDSVERSLGRVGVLVLNATPPQLSTLVPDVRWQTHVEPLMQAFVHSPLLLTQAVVPGMTALGGGRIIHIASDVVERLPPANSAYIAAKAAQIGLVRATAVELGPLGITVNAVSPGWIPVERHAATDPDLLRAHAATVPLGRLGTPAEIAHAVGSFAVEEAGYTSGTVLTVNGGPSRP